MSNRRPSYKSGFARYAGESMRPGLWKGLVGLWAPMLGPTGVTLGDWSGRRKHGTLTNMDPATDWVPGPMGRALDFDGSDDYVDVPFGKGLNVGGDYTACYWAKITPPSVQKHLFSVYDDLFPQPYLQGEKKLHP